MLPVFFNVIIYFSQGTSKNGAPDHSSFSGLLCCSVETKKKSRQERKKENRDGDIGYCVAVEY